MKHNQISVLILPGFIVISILISFFKHHVYGYASQDMLEKGKAQYQLLQERGNLPQYGNCWKQAIARVEEGCDKLSEEIQSDIALHLTNCFLEMSGHDTYNCELDKKPNLRGICINGMTDRAFNVYTEFYTQTQNMCWFLRGQIWQERLSENTRRMGQQLDESAKNQEELLFAQKESLEIQEKLLKHGRLLEEVLDGLYLATKNHHDVLTLISQRIGNLQAWLIGVFVFIMHVITYKDHILEHGFLLVKIREQTSDISNVLSNLKFHNNMSKSNLSFEDERIIDSTCKVDDIHNNSLNNSFNVIKNNIRNSLKKSNVENNTQNDCGNSFNLLNSSLRYNLRSRQGTPVSNI